jgi:thiol-disulfide isomerase/thioredoxin
MNNSNALKPFLVVCLSVFMAFFAVGQANQSKTGSQPKPKPTGTNTTAKPKPATGAKPATTTAKKINNNNVGRLPGMYAIKVKIKGFKNVPLYLADNFGDKQYFRDTCFLDANGMGVFKGNPKLQRGMYMIVFPQMDGYYELPITDDQDFSFEADTSMDETKIMVTGSAENEAFVKYQKARAVFGRKRYALDQEYKKAKSVNDEVRMAEIKVEIDSMEKQDSRFREDYKAKNPTHLLSKLFTAFQTIKIPETVDSTHEYSYFKNHFWDNIDFKESGLIRAPQGLLTAKLNDFIDKVCYQDPDSLVQAVDFAISKTIPYTEIQKYFVQYLTNKFQDRKIMCQDNVTIHLIDKYYCKNDAWWYDDTAGKRKMCEEAKKAIPTMCGKIAPDLNMADTAGKMHRLYENMGKFTIIFFYDPTCGHCKEVIPVVNALFQKHKNNGIKVFAISTENKYDEWRKMMRERPELQEWVNVCKTDRYYPWPLNRYDYNIQANPTIFIIDEKGVILGKKIDEHQLEFFLESLMFEKGMISTKPTPPKDKPADDAKPAEAQPGNTPASGDANH